MIRGLIGVAAVVLALAIVWALLVPGADWLARHDIGSAKGSLAAARDAARGRLLTLGAGLLAAGALVFTARNFTLSREGQVTDRYAKAVEQLGSDKSDVRIGGIFALERIARDSAKDHPTVMEVLTTFIREHSREPWPVDSDGVQHGSGRGYPPPPAVSFANKTTAQTGGRGFTDKPRNRQLDPTIPRARPSTVSRALEATGVEPVPRYCRSPGCTGRAPAEVIHALTRVRQDVRRLDGRTGL